MTPARKLLVGVSLTLLVLLISPLGWELVGRTGEEQQLSFYRPAEAALMELIERAEASLSEDELGRLEIEEELARTALACEESWQRR